MTPSFLKTAAAIFGLVLAASGAVCVMAAKKPLQIIEIKSLHLEGPVDTYNLSITGNENYHVGNSRFLVHNCTPSEAAKVVVKDPPTLMPMDASGIPEGTVRTRMPELSFHNFPESKMDSILDRGLVPGTMTEEGGYDEIFWGVGRPFYATGPVAVARTEDLLSLGGKIGVGTHHQPNVLRVKTPVPPESFIIGVAGRKSIWRLLPSWRNRPKAVDIPKTPPPKM